MSNVCLRKLLLFQICSFVMSHSDRIENFSKLWKEFLLDPQFDFASISMTILDDRSGDILFEHQKNVGLPPASSMKTITAAAALHHLGENFTYSTTLKYSGTIDRQTGFLDGFLYIVGSGDPSLGSDRFDESTKGDAIISQWVQAIDGAGIRRCRGVVADPTGWGTTKSILVDGWTWNDIGQYYGTAHSALNWRENEFLIEIQPGEKIGDAAVIKNVRNAPAKLKLTNEIRTVESGTDISLSLSVDGSNDGFLRGTIDSTVPTDFSVRCATPDSALDAAAELTGALRSKAILVDADAQVGPSPNGDSTELDVHRSPPLSKLLEPFLRVSMNMYGEVLVRTIALRTASLPHEVLRLYAKTLLDGPLSLAVATTDGSGLSRSNRLTTFALAKILVAVQKESWFDDVFFNALPTINGLRMKSGTLTNTIAYAGYVREHHFVFSFMINNFYGKTAQQMREKIWAVLDALK